MSTASLDRSQASTGGTGDEWDGLPTQVDLCRGAQAGEDRRGAEVDEHRRLRSADIDPDCTEHLPISRYQRSATRNDLGAPGSRTHGS